VSLARAVACSAGLPPRKSSSVRRMAASMTNSKASRLFGEVGSMLCWGGHSPSKHRFTMMPQCVKAGALPQKADTTRSTSRRRSPR